jgi:putative oxidoreductase
MNRLYDIGALVGRVLMALIFIGSGANKFSHPDMISGYMQANHIPAVMPLLYLSAIIELGGGILLLLGIYSRWVALVIVLWLIPVTVMMHIIPGGQLNQIEMMKNFAIMGGLLILWANGPGAFRIVRD